MKSASAPLIALLATRQFNYAGLYQFSLVGGTSLYYCSGDTDVLTGGHTYSAGGTTGPYFDTAGNKAKAHWKRGLEVDTLTFDVMPGSSTINGQAFLSAVRQGA